jgi:O-antigen ligase
MSWSSRRSAERHRSPTALEEGIRQEQLLVILRGAEWLFAGVGLSVFAGGLFGFLVSPLAAGAPGGPLWLMAKVAIYLGSLGLLLLRPGALWSTLRRHPATIVVIALALASSLWSVSPLVTLKRGAVLAGTALFGIYLASRFRSRELLQLLGVMLAATAVISLVQVYLGTGRGVAGGLHPGDWFGVYGHKNTLGLHMALGTLVFVSLARDLQRKRWLAWLGAGLCLVLLLGSRAATSIVATAAVALALPLVSVVRHRSTGHILGALGILTLLGSGAMVLSADAGSALTFIGKESSLSGRLPLWAVLMQQVRIHPWLGYGYGAFWPTQTAWDGGPSDRVAEILGWYPWHAHNGLLNLDLELGIVGVGVFLLGYAIAVFRGVSLLQVSPNAGMWRILLLVFLLVASMSEALFLRHDDVFTVLYVATVFLQGEPTLAGVPSIGRRDMSEHDGAEQNEGASPHRAAGPVLTPGVSRALRRRPDGAAPRAGG